MVFGIGSGLTAPKIVDIDPYTNSVRLVRDADINIPAVSCDNEEFIWEGHNKQIGILPAGVYTIWDSLKSVHGCDSIYQLTLTVNPTYIFDTTMEMCQGDTIIWRSQIITNAGVYYDRLTSMTGCDSTYKMTMFVHPTYHFTDTMTICDNQPYTWHGRLCDKSGSYFDTLKTVNGCDSIIELTLTVLPTFFAQVEMTTCQFDTPRWNNMLISTDTAGTFTHRTTLTAANGCDSVCELVLTVNPVIDHIDTLYACASDQTFEWQPTGSTVDTSIVKITLPQGFFNTQEIGKVEYRPNEFGCLEKYELKLIVWPAFLSKE